jgi:lysozyme family protein
MIGIGSDDALFAQAVAVLLEHEGGLVEPPADKPGLLTNWGFQLSDNPDLTAESLRAMTRDQAIARYREKWWNTYRWRELPPAVAVKCFDLAVNMGPGPLVRCLQRALWAAGKKVKEDGNLGTGTITAAADAAPGELLAALRSEAGAFYRADVAAHPAMALDLAGWLARAYS